MSGAILEKKRKRMYSWKSGLGDGPLVVMSLYRACAAPSIALSFLACIFWLMGHGGIATGKR